MLKLPHLFSKKNTQHWIGILALLALAIGTVNLQSHSPFFLTSVSNTPQVEPFDGTVMPIQNVPNWSALSSGENKYSYSQLSTSKLISIPEYRNDYFTYPSADLKWGDSQSAIIRNTKITYSVPYSGNYELDDAGIGAGSHPAVDIKTLKGTPVYVIANGLVDVAGSSSTWGNYVVVKHVGVPDPDQSGKKVTLYSVYAHMDTLYVKTGDVLTKGAVIGQVGDTGTATTPHLHFQIDKDTAPWHPYWPFTTAEAKAAGYNFWEAVSAGVGQDNVYKYTIDPVAYVQKYLDASAIIEEEPEVIEEDTTEVSPVETPDETVLDPVENTSTESSENEEEVESSVVTINFDDMSIKVPSFTQPGQNPEITLKLLDGNGKWLKDASFDGEMTVSVSDESVGKLNRSTLTQEDFTNGVASVNFYADHAGECSITVTLAGRNYSSTSFYVVDTIEPFAKFGIAHDGYFVPNKTETIQIQALDLEGRPTPGFYGDGTVQLKVVQGSGILEPSSLTKKDLSSGIAEVQFTGSSSDDVVIEAVYGTKTTESDTLVARLFNDFDASQEYYEAVSYLYRSGVVQGYPDGTFQASRTVSRVEALKFIFAGLDQSVSSTVTASYKDTSMKEWYSGYLASASTRGIVQGYPDGSFKPTQGVNRVEFLKILFNTVDLSIDPVVQDNPYTDVDRLSWYAPYVQYSKEKNLFPNSGSSFDPAEPMSRVEVAEVIYRMITVLDNGENKYSVLERPRDY